LALPFTFLHYRSRIRDPNRRPSGFGLRAMSYFATAKAPTFIFARMTTLLWLW